jgi:hypothetical protein
MTGHGAAIRLLTILLLLAAPAVGAEVVTVRSGDRVTGDLPGGSTEAGMSIEALEGTILDLRVKGEIGLEPEILLFDPEDVRVDPSSRYRHPAGSRKARIKGLPLTLTGRYTIVIRAAGESAGAYRLKIRAQHPMKFKERGAINPAGTTLHLRFPAFEGTRARIRVKGRNGLMPAADRMMRPGALETTLTSATLEADPIVHHDDVECPGLGDYWLEIGGRGGSTGEWRAKVKLTHPASAPRDIEAHGEPAGTFTGGMRETPSAPPTSPPPSTSPPGPASPWRTLDQGNDSGIFAYETAVARSPAQYAALWSRHRPTGGATAPAVDFAKEMVIAVFLGSRPTGTTVQIVYAQKYDAQMPPQPVYLLVGISDSSIALGNHLWPNQPTGPTQPYVIVAVPTFSGPVDIHHVPVIE